MPLLFFNILCLLIVVVSGTDGLSLQAQYVKEKWLLGSIGTPTMVERCQIQLRQLVVEKRLCHSVTYFYSFDCQQLEHMVLMHLLWLEREQGWPISLEHIELQMVSAGIFSGSMGGLCAMKDRTYDVFWKMYRDGILAPRVLSEGLAAWFIEKSCPSSLWLIKYNMSAIVK